MTAQSVERTMPVTEENHVRDKVASKHVALLKELFDDATNISRELVKANVKALAAPVGESYAVHLMSAMSAKFGTRIIDSPTEPTNQEAKDRQKELKESLITHTDMKSMTIYVDRDINRHEVFFVGVQEIPHGVLFPNCRVRGTVFRDLYTRILEEEITKALNGRLEPEPVVVKREPVKAPVTAASAATGNGDNGEPVKATVVTAK